MTALASGAQRNGVRRRLLPRSLTSLAWVVWRQHRATLCWLGGLFLAVAAGMLIAGIAAHRLYGAAVQHGCPAQSSWTPLCRQLLGPFATGWLAGYPSQVILAMQAVPVIVGVFLGAPLLAREYTTGTARFTWTQGVGRTRWTLMTLGLLGAGLAAAGGVLGLLAQWSVQPSATQSTRYADRWEPGFFDHTPLTAATAILLAFAIGVLAGAAIRRVVAAMAVTAVAAITAAGLTYTRLHYWLLSRGTLVTRDQAFGASPNVGGSGSTLNIHELVGRSVPGPAGSWLDQGWYTGPDGHRLSEQTVTQLLDKYTGTNPAWLTRLHDTFWVSYQPGGRYWIFQSILGGGTLLLALLLAAATVWVVRRRRA